VRRGGKYVALKPKEFELLRFLARHPGQVFTREQLLDHVWGHGFVGENRTVDVHVRWLREKIEASPSEPALIETVRGVGYRAAGGTPSLSHAEDREDPQATQDREASQTGQAT
jgi:DNA-binding response OmpR family regulator